MSRFDASTLERALTAVKSRQEATPALETPAPKDEVLAILLPLLRRWEGLRLRPYLCSAGVPTIGYGPTYYLDGRRVTLQDPPITREHAEVLLKNMVMREYLPAVRRLCPTADTPGRVAALTSFAYNLGVHALRASTLRRCVLAGDWEGAKAQLMRWTRAGGVVVRGLVARRKDEAALM